MPKPTPGTVIMVTGHTGVDIMVTDMATMVTMARDLLMKLPLLNLAPTPMPKPTLGMVIMVTGTGLTVMDTMARDLLMKLPLLNLAPTPMPKPTPGMVIM